WEQALSRFGSGAFSRGDLLSDAIGYARGGYLVTPTMQSSSQDELTEISAMDTLSAYYLDDLGLPPETGSVIKNPDLAGTYELIAEGGADAFYKGAVAEAIVGEVKALGGVMETADLESYEPLWREPLVGSYRGYTVYALPPSSSGGTHLLEILNILETYDMASLEVNGPQYVHLMAEAMKLAFADRAKYMADTAFADVPLDTLISKEYGAARAALISDGNGSYDAGDTGAEHGSTTSFSVVDKDGNMLTCTQTIGDFYGSKIAIPGYGFIMNDEMYDFDTDPESVNCAAGGKRPLSSITPTFVTDPEGNAFLTIGTPGGARIFGVIAQIIQRMIDYGMDIQEAIETVRVFASDEGSLTFEEDGLHALADETLEALTEMGYTLTPRRELDLYFGGVQGIECKPDGLHAGADPRRTGKALAY
ncbi:MAG: gamma-glutamyltransferase family protein, partial [Firmicutes bacterium]|nr:gamma-glutamyltransferase family protein [Bacillota bacterium]